MKPKNKVNYFHFCMLFLLTVALVGCSKNNTQEENHSNSTSSTGSMIGLTESDNDMPRPPLGDRTVFLKVTNYSNVPDNKLFVQFSRHFSHCDSYHYSNQMVIQKIFGLIWEPNLPYTYLLIKLL